jgi:phosphoglucosamine mutase
LPDKRYHFSKYGESGLRKLFGTDGVRGRVGEEPITPHTVLQLAWAAGRVLGRGAPGGTVLIGKDTRVSGYLLESALEAGLSAAGLNVSLLGPMPTPAVAYLAKSERARAGVVVSASHNPYHDNGIKFFATDGGKLADEIEHEIEAEMDKVLSCAPPAQLGKAKRFTDAANRYVEFCKTGFGSEISLRGLRVVVDSANGAAYQIGPRVLAELGATVIPIADQPDGFNINAGCGSTHPQLMQETVREQGADLGFALDGDGDRVILADSRGNLIDGDAILYVLAQDRQRRGQAGGVVGTLMSNLGLEQACKRMGVPFRRAAVGDRYVLALLRQTGWRLGGETSGHIISLDHATTGDGIVAALQVLRTVIETSRPLAELTRDMTVYPQKMINVRLPSGSGRGRLKLEENAPVQEALRAAQAELAEHGRVVLRASGTEPVVRVMVEADDRGLVERISGELAAVVAAAHC